MTSLVCFVADASEANEVEATLVGLRSAGRVRVLAPSAHVASIQAAGVKVDAPLAGQDPPALVREIEKVLRNQAPAIVLIAHESALLASAQAAVAASGGPVALLCPAAGDVSLALEDFVDLAKRSIQEIAPEEALRILEAPGHEGWHFVDVREPDEYAAGYLPGARSAPRGFLEVRADLVHYKRDPWFENRDRPMIVYCGGGHRSALAVATLQRMGFTKLLSLAEGYTGWTERNHPLETPQPQAR